MSPSDIEAFLAIRRQIAQARWLQIGIAVLAIVAWAAVIVVGAGDRELRNLLMGFAIAAGLGLTAGSRTDVARDRLVALVEKQINNDPQALRELARQQAAR